MFILAFTLLASQALSQKRIDLFGTSDCRQETTNGKNSSIGSSVFSEFAMEGQCYAGTVDCKTPFDLTGNSSRAIGASDFQFCKNTSRNYKCENDGSVTINWYTLTSNCSKSSNSSSIGGTAREVLVRNYPSNGCSNDIVRDDGYKFFNFGANGKCSLPVTSSSTKSVSATSTKTPSVSTSVNASTSSDCSKTTTTTCSTMTPTSTFKPSSQNYLVNEGSSMMMGSLIGTILVFFALV